MFLRHATLGRRPVSSPTRLHPLATLAPRPGHDRPDVGAGNSTRTGRFLRNPDSFSRPDFRGRATRPGTSRSPGLARRDWGTRPGSGFGSGSEALVARL